MGSTITREFQSIDSSQRKTYASTNADFHRWMGNSSASSRGLIEGSRNLLFDLVEKVFGHRLDRRQSEEVRPIVCGVYSEVRVRWCGYRLVGIGHLAGSRGIGCVSFRKYPVSGGLPGNGLNISRTMFFYSKKLANNSIARAKIDRICSLSREILISTNVLWIWKECQNTWIGSTSSLRIFPVSLPRRSSFLIDLSLQAAGGWDSKTRHNAPLEANE